MTEACSTQVEPKELMDGFNQRFSRLSLDHGDNLHYISDSDYGIYIIYSNWALPDVRKFISNIISGDDSSQSCSDDILIGPMRISYIKGEESEKTIAILHSSVYDRLVREGFDKKLFTYDFRIQPYEIRENNKPDPGYSSNLYIPLPTALDKNDCQQDILSKLQLLEKFNIIPHNSFKVTLPVISRRTGESTRSAFIEFSPDVPINNRAVVRLILNDSDWTTSRPTKRNYRVKCLWAADRKSRKKPKTPRSSNPTSNDLPTQPLHNSNYLFTQPKPTNPYRKLLPDRLHYYRRYDSLFNHADTRFVRSY